jgi:uncharacterized protein YdcH (DUF465 family)
MSDNIVLIDQIVRQQEEITALKEKLSRYNRISESGESLGGEIEERERSDLMQRGR